MSNMDLSGDFAQGWRPSEGDVLIGKVTDLGQNWDDYRGSYYPILTIEPKEGGDAVAVHAFHHSLRQQILNLRPQVGETVGIRFKGKQPTKDGKRTVAVYILKVQGRTVDIYANMTQPERPRVPTSDIPVTAEDFKPAGSTAAADDDDIPF